MDFRPRRRIFLKAAASAIPAGMVVPTAVMGDPISPAGSRADAPAPAFFTDAERAFVDAALARLIPADDLGPGAKESGGTVFIDRQLSGPYGRADTWYMQGPFREGTDEQGYQLKLTPAQLYRTAIEDVDALCRKQHGGKTFAQLDANAQDEVLHGLEKGKLELERAPAKDFFDILWQNTMESFLADPIYGGNRGFAGWKLIGFPGPRYNYVKEIERYGERYTLPEVSIAGRDPWHRKERA